MNEFKSKSIREVIEIDEILSEKENGSKESEILVNHLLIYIYTTYEKEIKKIIQKTYDYMSRYNYYSPVLSSVSVNRKKWVPSLNKIDLEAYFPILKEWDFWNKNGYVHTETLVAERHKYAHTGSHRIIYDQILRSFVEIIYIVHFLNHIYDLEHAQKNIVFQYFSNHNKDKLTIGKQHKPSIEGLIKGNHENVPGDLKIIYLDTVSSIKNNLTLSNDLSNEFKIFLGIDKLNELSFPENPKESPQEFLDFFNKYIEMTEKLYPDLTYSNNLNIIRMIQDTTDF